MHMKQPASGSVPANAGRQFAASRPQGGKAAGPQRTPGPTVDWVRLAWTNRWLLLLGLATGLAGGYFQFVQSPAIFQSAARVQIVESSSKNLPMKGLESSSAARSLRDEALVMRSERILKRAAELGELSTTPEFAGMAPEQIAAMVGGESLVVGPAADGDSASVFEIQYACTSSPTCQRVVQSVIDAYAMHLQDQYRNVGQETLDLIQTARNEVLAKLNKLEDEFSQFKRESALIFRDGATTSVHRDNADSYLAQKQTLILQKGRLASVLESVRMAMQENRPLESVLISMQLPGSSGADANIETKMANDEVARLKESNQLMVSDRMRREQLLPLQIDRQEMSKVVGVDHPALQTLDQRIRTVEGTIEEIAKSERKFQSQLEAAWSKSTEGEATKMSHDDLLEQKVRIGVMALRQQLESLAHEEMLVDEAYRSEMEAAKSESVAETKSAQFYREIDRQQQLYNRIMERLDEVNLMSESSGLKVFPLDTAKPGYQIAPSLAKSLLMGGFLGCMFAGGLAFLRDFTDKSYHSASEIAEHIGLPVIGHVPVLAKTRMRDLDPQFEKIDPRLITVFGGKGSKSESFRAIRTAIYFSNQSGNNQVLQVTSATPGDGKSTIAANLAASIAQSGRSVLLIDADLRRPRVHKLLGMEAEKGLAWAIERTAEDPKSIELSISEAILDTVVPNLSVMLAGVRPENPAELLSSSSFEKLLDVLRTKFDMIIVDTPPLLAVSDPSNVVSRADGVVMVVRLRKNIKPAVAQAARMLETLEANVVGLVVNGVGSRQARGYGKEYARDGYYNYGQYYKYGYGYSYGYSANNDYSEYYDESKPKKRRQQSKRRQPEDTAETKPA